MADPWADFRDPWAGFRGADPVTAIDFTAPDKDVRAKIAALPETSKKAAQDKWAEERVRKTYKDTGFTPMPEFAKGIPIIGPLLDEASAGIQGAVNYVSGGQVGRPYDEALAYERAREKAADTASPVGSTVGKLAAGVAAGGPVFSRIAPATTLAGRVGQGIGIGAGVGAAEGFGAGEGSVGNRLGTAGGGAAAGGLLGAALPVGAAAASRGYGYASDLLGPTVTRMRHGVEEAADRILARRIERAGSSPAQIRLDLQRGQNAARLNSNSNATLPETIADTSDDLQRLTGSLYRSGGEAGNTIRTTLDARQRGPGNLYGPQPPGPPQGQHARVLDTTERAMLIRSSDTALRTERQIMQAQAQEGRRLYRQAFQNQQPFDIQGTLDAMAVQAQQYPAPFQAKLMRALNLFRLNDAQRMPVNTLERFDNAKKALDDMIDVAQRGGQNNLVRELTLFKNALLDNVHGRTGGGAISRNQDYHNARQAWATAAEQREAIDLGRAALRQGSEISVEQYQALTQAQQQLFRIGFLESLRNALGSKRPGNDVTQLFQQRRVQELMNAVVPASRGRNSVFIDRPERFGELMNREGRMVQTRTNVLGNSATAQRQQDDMSLAGDALASMWNRFRQSPSLFNMGIEAVGTAIQRVFGYRQDVALALAQRLLETDRTAQNQILRRLMQRGGADRFARFADMVDRSSQALVGSTAGPIAIEDGRTR